ncbi:MAG TPA: hypothetical protein VFV38_33710 [Ktedonobacteraceae bacterium]|nr:hypothetical protein [Ktedonobacteraceae bacterium]
MKEPTTESRFGRGTGSQKRDDGSAETSDPQVPHQDQPGGGMQRPLLHLTHESKNLIRGTGEDVARDSYMVHRIFSDVI